MSSGNEIIKIDTSQMNKLLNQLAGFPQEAAKANYAAAKRAAERTVTIIGSKVSKRYAVKANALKSYISRKKVVKPKLLSGTKAYIIIIKGHLLPVTAFPHTIEETTVPSTVGNSRVKYRIKARVMKSGRRKEIKRSNADGSVARAFLKVPREESDTEGLAESAPVLFIRKSKRSRPLMEPKVLSVPQMITNDEVAGVITQEAQETYMKRLEHEVEYRLGKMAERVNKA